MVVGINIHRGRDDVIGVSLFMSSFLFFERLVRSCHVPNTSFSHTPSTPAKPATRTQCPSLGSSPPAKMAFNPSPRWARQLGERCGGQIALPMLRVDARHPFRIHVHVERSRNGRRRGDGI